MKGKEKGTYGSQSTAKEALCARFATRWKTSPELLLSSPGRAEIVGNHTDHNCGKAIVSALSCAVVCAAGRRQGAAEIVSEGFRPIFVEFTSLSPREEEKGKSASLVRGVLAYFRQKGYPLVGFRAVTASSVFRGAGVSSSAAFSVLIARAASEFAHVSLSPLEMAKAAQFAEREYFGKPCGLLDQCGVAFGGLRYFDFADPSSPETELLPLPRGYVIVLTETGASHARLTAHYAAVREEMCAVARHFGKETLRRVTEEEVLSDLPALRRETGDRAVLRALHYFAENERVERAAHALKTGDIATFTDCIRESGESSVRLLQNAYLPGSVFQPVLIAVETAKRVLKKGACRGMGGGFGGSVLAVLPEEESGAYCTAMARVFGQAHVHKTSLRGTGVSAEKI